MVTTHQTIELYSGIHVFYIIGTVQNHDKCPRFDARDGIPDFVVAFFVVFLGGLYLLDAQFLYVLVQVLLSTIAPSRHQQNVAITQQQGSHARELQQTCIRTVKLITKNIALNQAKLPSPNSKRG